MVCVRCGAVQFCIDGQSGGVLTEQAPDWVRPEYLQPLLELGDASRFQYTWMDKELRAVAPVPSTPLRVVIVESAVSQQLGERLKTSCFGHFCLWVWLYWAVLFCLVRFLGLLNCCGLQP